MFSRLRCRDWVPHGVGWANSLDIYSGRFSISFTDLQQPLCWRVIFQSKQPTCKRKIEQVCRLDRGFCGASCWQHSGDAGTFGTSSRGRHELAWKLLAGYRLWRRHCFVFRHIQPSPFRTATALATLTALCCLGTWVQRTLVTQIFTSRVPCRHKVFIFAKLKRTILLTFR